MPNKRSGDHLHPRTSAVATLPGFLVGRSPLHQVCVQSTTVSVEKVNPSWSFPSAGYVFISPFNAFIIFSGFPLTELTLSGHDSTVKG